MRERRKTTQSNENISFRIKKQEWERERRVVQGKEKGGRKEKKGKSKSENQQRPNDF